MHILLLSQELLLMILERLDASFFRENLRRFTVCIGSGIQSPAG
jgi:hypothetical protein